MRVWLGSVFTRFPVQPGQFGYRSAVLDGYAGVSLPPFVATSGKVLRGTILRWGQEGKSAALLLSLPVQQLAATIGQTAAKRLRPTRHVFGAILWDGRVIAIKICMLVTAVAHQWPQMPDQQLIGSP